MGSYEDMGPQIDKHLPQSSFTGQLFKMKTFWNAFFESYLSTVQSVHCTVMHPLCRASKDSLSHPKSLYPLKKLEIRAIFYY
jgi:hypothetical protein